MSSKKNIGNVKLSKTATAENARIKFLEFSSSK